MNVYLSKFEGLLLNKRSVKFHMDYLNFIKKKANYPKLQNNTR